MSKNIFKDENCRKPRVALGLFLFKYLMINQTQEL